MAQRKKRRSRAKHPGGLPKGAYRLPTGGYAEIIGRFQTRRGQQFHIVGIRREQPDVERIAQAVLELARQLAREASESDTRPPITSKD